MTATGCPDTFGFISGHPNKKWNSKELSKIQSLDFQDFDMSLCAKWLTEFRWTPQEPRLSQPETDSVVKLRNLRNDIKHKSNVVAPEQEYALHRQTVEDSLLAPGVDPVQISEILLKADDVTLVNKTEMLTQVQTATDAQ